MDRQTWAQVRRAVDAADRRVPRRGRRTVYGDRLIVKLYLWAARRDRPMSWAFEPLHFGPLFRPRRGPSYSQFCRRVRSARFGEVLAETNRLLSRAADAPGELGFLDGKAPEVSENTRDPDARTGRGNGRFARGYKLHAWVAQTLRVAAFAVTPLNAGETTVARERLAGRLPRHALTLADGNYDSDLLHRAMAARGHALLTPLKGSATSRRRVAGMSPQRLAAVARWRAEPQACRELMGARGGAERAFANLTNFGGGLTHLPPWVRTLGRVTRWVTAKLAIYHARMNAREELRSAA